MKVRFQTRSGTQYLIDHDERIWYRVDNPDSRNVRTRNGVFWDISAIEVGQPVVLTCPPFVEDAVHRRITTTPVIEVEYL